ncbi:MAG: HAMP domain-containing sensor histidine kinase [Lutibacter sp.]|uniref:sensor histidine kinase n=1 Tax=Lutibacter sp. TaxID=1925666 RepID=UPI00299D55F1|nr:HAMP domain-containing sensor histidine kinase [Lutibacter sp.]MDX1829694.1 HAMP domain-containing sensor histidine kinase [Lutibacter sp.]
MVDIDVKTLFVFSAIANIFIIALFVTYIKLYKVKSPIINIFILSRVLGIIFLIILSLRDGVPKPLGIIINTTINLFIMFYEIYCISFIERKFDSKHFKRFILIPLFFSVVLSFFSTSPVSERISIRSLSVAIMYAFAAYILLTEKGKTKIQRITGYILPLVSILLVMRAFGAILNVNVNMHSTNYMLIIPLVFFLILNLIIPLLLLFILKEKDNETIEIDNIKLSELNKSKDKFFSIIAHDLRGPLGGLQQIGELLWLNNITTEKREKLTNVLYQNSKNTFNLLDNLLKWANASSGLIVYKPSQLNIHEIVLNNMRLFSSQVKFKNLNLTCNFENDIFVYADYEMIDTVIRNLISNAIKYTYEGGKIEIILVEINKSNNTCTLAVVDNGVGINKEAQLKIFEIESTVSTLGTKDEKGTGLGLKLCKEFLTINKGSIWIESEENKGTSVFISLPIKIN